MGTLLARRRSGNDTIERLTGASWLCAATGVAFLLLIC